MNLNRITCNEHGRSSHVTSVNDNSHAVHAISHAVHANQSSLNAETATATDIQNLYHAHGTSEQFHSEIKTDLDLERLPSGKFNTNAIVLALGITAYNLLRIIGQESLKKNDYPPTAHKVKRRRIRTIIDRYITLAVNV